MFPLLLAPRPSRVTRGGIVLFALLSAFALWLADLPWSVRLAGLGMLAAALALASPSRAPTLRCKADGGLAVRRAETWKPVAAEADSIALPWLVVLIWREEGRRRRLAIPFDALTPEEHRRLRLWLRWRVKPVGEAPVESAG